MLISLALLIAAGPSLAANISLDSSAEVVTVSVSADAELADAMAELNHDAALAEYQLQCVELGGLLVVQDPDITFEVVLDLDTEVVIRQTVSCLSASSYVEACLDRSRISEDEAAAAGALKTLATAQTGYNNNSSPHTYRRVLEPVSESPAPIEDVYRPFDYHVFEPIPDVEEAVFEWEADVADVVAKRTGVRSFYIDETGVICGTDSEPTVSLPEP